MQNLPTGNEESMFCDDKGGNNGWLEEYADQRRMNEWQLTRKQTSINASKLKHKTK